MQLEMEWPHMDLEEMVARFRLSDQDWRILEDRVNQGLTLQVVGEREGLTRERIRQREKRAMRYVRQRLGYAADAYDLLEGVIRQQQKERDIAGAVKWSRRCLDAAGWSRASNTCVLHLLLAVRVAVSAGGSSVVEEWPELSYRLCAMEPRIMNHPEVKALVEKEAEARRNLTYAELAEMVLAEAGEPLHWSVIAERAEGLGRRQRFSPSTMANALVKASGVFVRVDSGTYGLAEWGMAPAEYYSDIFAKILQAEGRTMTAEELAFRAETERPVKRSTLLLTMDLNPRFYKSVEGRYGLRAWLPPRAKQTLRTPDWLVEDKGSYERVQRAEGRGYNVGAIVARDQASQE